MLKFITLFIITVLQINTFADNNSLSQEISRYNSAKEIELYQCVNASDKKILMSGWQTWEPYQYNHIAATGYVLTGMDIELVKLISNRVGINIRYNLLNWNRLQTDLKNGNRDLALGATYKEERAQYAYFSLPYRYEEDTLFIKRDSIKKLIFNNISEYVAQVRLRNFRLGVIKGFVYADNIINEFIADNINKDIIFVYDNDEECINALVQDEIDGFMTDRIVGANAILKSVTGSKIIELPLNLKVPIHFMFSKYSVPLDLVDKFNKEIQNLSNSQEYRNIVKNYLYPVVLLQTIDSAWFYIIGMIGTISFAISGVAIAAKENTTLFGTFLFAMLPSVAGGIMRDVMINRDNIEIILTPSYMYYIIIIVVLGFIIVRLLNYYNSNSDQYGLLYKFWSNLLVVCDALGQATLIVIGVCIVVMVRIEPIELWGAFFAFLTSNGGGILRDLIRSKGYIECMSDTINAELSLLWGLIFSIFLNMNAYNPDQNTVKYVVITIVIAAFSTRLLTHYLNIRNIRFYNE